MRGFSRLFMLAAVLTAVAACSPTDSRQVPVVNGVPLAGYIW